MPGEYVAQFAPEIRDNPAWAEHGTITDLGKAYLSLKDAQSKAITLPTENATPEQVRAFYDKLGVPKAPTEYDVSTDGLPEDAKALEQMFRDNALKAGLTKGQAKKQWELLSGVIKTGTEQHKTQQDALKQTFPARLASALDKDYPVKAERDQAATEAQNLFKAFADRTGLTKALEAGNLHLDPAVVLAIAKDEKTRQPGEFQRGSDGKAPQQGTMGHYSAEFIAKYGKK